MNRTVRRLVILGVLCLAPAIAKRVTFDDRVIDETGGDIATCEHKMPKENDGRGNFAVSLAWWNSQFPGVWRNDALAKAAGAPAIQAALRKYGRETADALPAYHLSLVVDAAGFARRGKIVEVDINFTQRLKEAGSSRPFDRDSLRLAEVDARGAVLNASVPFQFDTPGSLDPADRAVGTLVFEMTGETPAAGSRRYHLYFGEDGPKYAKPEVPERVTLEDIGEYEGFPTWRIKTPAATYYYHKRSAGFASLVDRDGNDWISYHPDGGAKGNYRGIPNIAPPQFHPGRPDGKKGGKIVYTGPVRLRILGETEDGTWGTLWDIYPNYARMTLFKAGDEPYWILYEGTPGGEFNETDYWVDSGGRRFTGPELTGKNKWNGDLPAPEWVYFGDAALDRVLYFARHEYSDAIDEYWHFGEGGMTVFGFGRGPKIHGWQRLRDVPTHLTVGFADETSHAGASSWINSAYRDVKIAVQKAERAR